MGQQPQAAQALKGQQVCAEGAPPVQTQAMGAADQRWLRGYTWMGIEAHGACSLIHEPTAARLGKGLGQLEYTCSVGRVKPGAALPLLHRMGQKDCAGLTRRLQRGGPGTRLWIIGTYEFSRQPLE